MVYAQQLGWLNQSPGESDETRLESAGEWDDFPDVGELEYIKRAARQMRLFVHGPSGGRFPHSWESVVSFAKNVAYLYEGYEIQALFEMSEAYCLEYSGARDPLRTSPMARYRRDRK